MRPQFEIKYFLDTGLPESTGINVPKETMEKAYQEIGDWYLVPGLIKAGVFRQYRVKGFSTALTTKILQADNDLKNARLLSVTLFSQISAHQLKETAERLGLPYDSKKVKYDGKPILESSD